MYATSEVAPINDLARITVHRQHQMILLDDNDHDNNANNDDATAQLHGLSWPCGQISQKKKQQCFDFVDYFNLHHSVHLQIVPLN